MKSFTASLLLLVLITGIATLLMNAVEGKASAEIDLYRRSIRQRSGCYFQPCYEHSDCCPGFECYLVPAACVLPANNMLGLCYVEQIQC